MPVFFIDVTSLQLVSLDISGNRISVLPVELRNMSSLVTLELTHNPLTTPPASVSTYLVSMSGRYKFSPLYSYVFVD